ncbi:hypothetical protein [Jiangella sp. DSM 45060]|uniref:hypothetical protein n=1 Tax=Jiangella sp. DSM 45060 TaxID=1798224 RepID=UPI00087D2A04|nr:hypothetical protein [Jiangella sp. DSM 45060]SDT11660.1 hypothetical protein SAMN04515669_2826 [Jiangella sp. DSM 45060]
MTGRYAELLRWAHDGEVFGAAFLRALAGGSAHTEHRAELTALLDLEERTLALLAPVVAASLGPVDDAAALSRAAAYAARVAAAPWDAFLTDLADGAVRALPRFAELVAAAPADQRVRFERLAEHERVVGEFARLSLAGDTPSALAVVEAHLR